jgi:hypothetical protein
VAYYLETPTGERKPISESTYLYAVKVRNFWHVLRDERVTIITGKI